MTGQTLSLHYARFTDEEDAYIRATYPLGKVSDMSRVLQRSERSIVSRAHNLKIKKLDKGKRASVIWTPELRELTALLYADMDTQELAEFLGVSSHMVKDEAQRQKLRKSKEFITKIRREVLRTVQFSAGNRPWNEGISEPGHPMHGRGHYRNGPHPRTLPVGTIKDRRRLNGKKHVTYRVVKVAERNWRPLHQWTWEQHHGKPVPPGHSIVFRDGDHDNYSPDNLLCLTFEELSMCSTQSLPYDVLPLIKRNRALSRAIKAREKAAKQSQ